MKEHVGEDPEQGVQDDRKEVVDHSSLPGGGGYSSAQKYSERVRNV